MANTVRWQFDGEVVKCQHISLLLPPSDEIIAQDLEVMNSAQRLMIMSVCSLMLGWRRMYEEDWQKKMGRNTGLYSTDSYPFNLEGDNLLLPLVHIHDTEPEEDFHHEQCPICRQEGCYGDIQNAAILSRMKRTGEFC